jgi:iron complex transport system substrate-binding protein
MAGKTLLARDATAEQVAPLQPDLVILKTYMREKIGMPIETLGIPVIYLDLETPEQFYIDLRTIGQVFGNSTHAEDLIAMYQANEARISEGLSGLSDSEKPSVLVLEHKDKGGELTFSVPPANYLQTVIVERAGGVPVWKDVITDGGWTVVNLEQIAAWDPQIIFIVDYSGTAVEVVTGLKQDPKWQAMVAGSTGKIYAFPSDFLSWDQPDPRWGLGELWLATRIYPEGFPSVDMMAEVRNFYTNYYGLDEKSINEKILPLLKGDL